MSVEFEKFFQRAVGDPTPQPYPYQIKLATEGEALGQLLNVPTGLGKTAAAILAWIWRRRFAGDAIRKQTPQRIVYCLPMRVLVEQTRGVAVDWLTRLGLYTDEAKENHSEWSRPEGDYGEFPIAVHLIMGGEEPTDWALWPERDILLIGTQDMLLSRALNRGYAARRQRWPMEFGLLNNDCLWVFDEVQLMGPGLATGLQLEAFRSTTTDGKEYFGTERPCVSWYMSATASRRMLTSREWRGDKGDKRSEHFVFELSHEEKNDRDGVLGQRRLATKELECQPTWTLENADVAQRILDRHCRMLEALTDAPASLPRRTLVVCNTVDRAKAIHAAIDRAADRNSGIDLVLLHSRFRPPDRARQQDRLKAVMDANASQIVVATQVIEAGLDLSSALLWTEIAPLPSIVQRLGRLNRTGEFGHDHQSKVGWTPIAILLGIPLPTPPTKQTKEEKGKYDKEIRRAYLPYDRRECEESQHALQGLRDVSPANLDEQAGATLDKTLRPPDYSLQRHELLDFFDTDSNLSLGYTDVSPFVRGIDPETDIYVAWRNWDGEFPPFDFDVGRSEICQVPIWQVIGKNGLSTWYRGFVWEGHQGESDSEQGPSARGWQRASRENVLPGATLLLPCDAGGYDDNLGWTGKADANVSILYQPLSRPSDEDLLSGLERGWQSIGSHTADVQSCWNTIREALALDDEELCAAIDETILWHDYGKSVRRWQAATRLLAYRAGITWPRNVSPIGKFSFSESPRLAGLSGPELYREVRSLRRVFAPRLRHEVASALALRQHHRRDGQEPTIYELLAEYLVMAHHGHVRKVLRDELPRDARRISRDSEVVRGIREGTSAPGFSVNGNALPPTERISIACRQMGRSPDGQEGWTRSVLRLLHHPKFGPFRLAYYEALVRAADCRASADPRTNVIDASPRDSGSALVGSATNGGVG